VSDHLFMSVVSNMAAQLRIVSEDMDAQDAAAKEARQARRSGQKVEGLNDDGSEKDEVIAARRAKAAAVFTALTESENKRISTLFEHWQGCEEKAELDKRIDNPPHDPLPDPALMRAERPGSFYAFTVLSKRRWLDLLRDRMKMRVQFSRYMFFAIVLGLVRQHNSSREPPPRRSVTQPFSDSHTLPRCFVRVRMQIFLQMGTSQEDVQNREGALFYIAMQSLFMTFMRSAKCQFAYLALRLHMCC